jgi:deazaflavin-dependent oxidoreductase (nitroreductase family)
MPHPTRLRATSTGLDWQADHTSRYLTSGGAEGHIIDLSAIGGLKFTTCLLLKNVGRKTGRILFAPLIYGDLDGEVIIVASKGGAPKDPAWYLNIAGAATVEFQIATQAFRATSREPTGDDRKRAWDFMVGLYPPYAPYQLKTSREIPVVMMSITEEIEPFSDGVAGGHIV